MTDISFESRRFIDVDEESKCMTGYEMEYRQLSRGVYRGRHSVARIGSDISINLERNNRTLIQSAITPPDQYTLYLILNEQEETRLNGRVFTHDHIFLSAPGSVWDTVDLSSLGAPEGSQLGPYYAAISMERGFFEEQVLGLRPDSPTLTILGSRSIVYEDKAALKPLKKNIYRLSGFVRDHCSKGGQIGIGFRSSVAEMLSAYLRRVLQHSVRDEVPTGLKPYKAVRRVRDHLEAHLDAEISINKLCRDMGLSRRTLEYYFHDQFGVSPMAYLRTARLNAVRRSLKAEEQVHLSIGDIAAQFGFWHPSRFAGYYREQFGELPSDTRSRIAFQ